MITFLESKNKKVIKCATTGIAADLIDGQTLHSVFKLPIPIFENCTSRFKENTPQAQQILQASLIIIDEVSLMSKHALHAINDILQRLANQNDIFCGKVVLLGGDFRQTANIIMKGKRCDFYESSIKHQVFGNLLKFKKLTLNMRSINHTDFNQLLLDVGDGKIDKLKVDKSMMVKNISDEIFDKKSMNKLLSNKSFLPQIMKMQIDCTIKYYKK